MVKCANLELSSVPAGTCNQTNLGCFLFAFKDSSKKLSTYKNPPLKVFHSAVLGGIHFLSRKKKQISNTKRDSCLQLDALIVKTSDIVCMKNKKYIKISKFSQGRRMN